MKRKVERASKLALAEDIILLISLITMIGIVYCCGFEVANLWKLIELAVQVVGGFTLVIMIIILPMVDEKIPKSKPLQIAKTHFWFSLILASVFMAIACRKGLIGEPFFSLEIIGVILSWSLMFAIIILIVEIACAEETEE